MSKCKMRIEWEGWMGGMFLAVVVLMVGAVGADIVADTAALAAFRAAVVDRGGKLANWGGANTDACSWTGVKCSGEPRVWELRLPGTGLLGTIPENTLGKLDQLRVVSLRGNQLSGPIPRDFVALTHLKGLYLQHNQLSGPLPENFAVWPRLVHLDFSSNLLTGNISASLGDLQYLLTVFLNDNKLTGTVPDITLANVPSDGFSVANNALSGPIPTGLSQKYPAAAFVGNGLLCGAPTSQPCASPPLPPPSVPGIAPPIAAPARGSAEHKKRGLSTGAIVAIVVGDAALLLLIVFVILFFCYKRRSKAKPPKPSNGDKSIEKGEDSTQEYSTSMVDPGRSKLVFFEGKRYTFDLEDLLRASAEVLGKGSVGTAYKAVLEDGSIVAVKRLKDVGTPKKEFETQIQMVGRLEHRNLVPLRAYYFSKDEKLLVYDYMAAGSVSALLHGSKGGVRTPLDWITRIRIALGAARGLAYLHDEQKLAHGNIKSSNLLLTRDLEACVSDFGLAQLLSSTPGGTSRIIGYRAPEVVETRKVSMKADVYSFGVLLLELLTGKAPTQANMNDEGIDLPRWVQSVVREEWTAEVFDLDLMRYQNIEEEMVQMLQIAMQCVSQVPDQRPTMDQVVKLLEDVRQFSDSTGDGSQQFDSSAEKSKDFDTLELPSEVHSENAATPTTHQS